MKTEWFYAENDQQQGPISEGELRNLWTVKTVTDDTLVWRDGMTDWIPYSQVMAQEGASSSACTRADFWLDMLLIQYLLFQSPRGEGTRGQPQSNSCEP